MLAVKVLPPLKCLQSMKCRKHCLRRFFKCYNFTKFINKNRFTCNHSLNFGIRRLTRTVVYPRHLGWSGLMDLPEFRLMFYHAHRARMSSAVKEAPCPNVRPRRPRPRPQGLLRFHQDAGVVVSPIWEHSLISAVNWEMKCYVSLNSAYESSAFKIVTKNTF